MNKLMISICGTRLHSFDKNYLTMQNPCKRLTFFCEILEVKLLHIPASGNNAPTSKTLGKKSKSYKPIFVKANNLVCQFCISWTSLSRSSNPSKPTHTHLNKYEGDMGSQTSFGAHQSGGNRSLFAQIDTSLKITRPQ